MKVPILVKQTDGKLAGDTGRSGGSEGLLFPKGTTEKRLQPGVWCLGLLPVFLDHEWNVSLSNELITSSYVMPRAMSVLGLRPHLSVC